VPFSDRTQDIGPVPFDLPVLDEEVLRIHAASVHAGEVAASEVMRILQRGGNPTQLGDALAHFGRAP
jgi:hypothetical protein